MTRQRLRRTILVASALLLPVTLNYFSPYLMTTGAALGIITGSFIVWVVWSLAALVVGRAGCGWVCPLNGVQLLCDKATHGKRLRRIRGLGVIRYVLWAAWVGAVIALVATRGVERADVLYLTPHVVSVDQLGNLITLTMIVAIAAVPALLLGRHAFCRYLCPFAPYNIIGTLAGRALRLPQLQLRLTGRSCSGCGSCAKTCPMSLPVDEMVAAGDLRRTDCIMCGSCADGCPRGVIAYGFAAPGPAAADDAGAAPTAESSAA
jgi:ferredoxin-type protein NapH